MSEHLSQIAFKMGLLYSEITNFPKGLYLEHQDFLKKQLLELLNKYPDIGIYPSYYEAMKKIAEQTTL